MTKRIKNENGITLVALIVTIIILLILAGVSIATLTESGLFEKARQAEQKSENAQIKEETTLADYENMINSYLTGNSETSDGEISTDTPEVYDPPVLLASKVNVGDYVAYDATNNYSYKSPVGTGKSHGNGVAEQTFTSSSNIAWRVLSVNESTDEVVLISETPLTNDAGGGLYFKGVVSYLYGEQEVHNACAIYGHGIGANTSKSFTYKIGTVADNKTMTLTGSGARSITASDLNKITGYVPKTGTTYTPKIYKPSMGIDAGYTTSAVATQSTNTAYGYYGTSYLDETDEIYKMLFRDITNSEYINYHLATRTVDADSSYADFNVVYVVGNQVYCACMYGSTSSKHYENGCIVNIRPIVYLKTTVKTTGKDSKGAWTIIDETN